MIHCYASRPHYMRHIRAVWKHLPAHERGQRLDQWPPTKPIPADEPVMVAALVDVKTVGHHQLIYVEHGAGQNYGGDQRSAGRTGYHGSLLPRRVAVALGPRAAVAHSFHYDDGEPVPGLVVGCPALDALPQMGRGNSTVTFTFHWDGAICSEARSAFRHYVDVLPAVVNRLRDQGFRVVGHWHPRFTSLGEWWRKAGVECEPSIERVLTDSTLIIADNTSVLYEAAALDIPVLALNAPWYRRDVEHGLRFWSLIPGWQIDDPAELAAFDFDSYVRLDLSATGRRVNIAAVYAPLWPHAGQVAARELLRAIA